MGRGSRPISALAEGPGQRKKKAREKRGACRVAGAGSAAQVVSRVEAE